MLVEMCVYADSNSKNQPWKIVKVTLEGKQAHSI